MKILSLLFFVVLYYGVKRVLETMVTDESPEPVDNNIITYDVLRGVPVLERKQRLASGYYYKR
ncbi:MAG: hypothetical protein J6R68_02480 [Clostridia bacterium]|nr:hypothetical protein [Clostridia bacterium]